MTGCRISVTLNQTGRRMTRRFRRLLDGRKFLWLAKIVAGEKVSDLAPNLVARYFSANGKWEQFRKKTSTYIS